MSNRVAAMPKERYIELDVTYKCSSQCQHCIFGSSPRKGGLMTVEDARTYLAETKALGLTGRDVIVTGGEALLFYPRILDIIRAAADLGMAPIRCVQSNGSWCTSDELTRHRLAELRDAGLGGMFFSADPFHQQFVPIERVRRGVRIAEEVFGPEQVHVSSSRSYMDAPAVVSVAEYIEKLRGSPPVMVARAAWALADHMPKIPLDEILEMKCRGGRQDIDPSSVWQINVDAYGCVSSWVCSGILLGNAHETPFAEIVSRPLNEQPALVQDLVERGPGAMLGMAEEHGFRPKDRYVSKCHLCWDIREAIHTHYPELFAPAELYHD